MSWGYYLELVLTSFSTRIPVWKCSQHQFVEDSKCDSLTSKWNGLVYGREWFYALLHMIPTNEWNNFEIKQFVMKRRWSF